MTTALPATVQSRLVCPSCHSRLIFAPPGVRCDGCDTDYPVVGGVPVLVRSDNSLFSLDTAGRLDGYVFSPPKGRKVKTTIRRFLPASATNLYAKQAMTTLTRALLDLGLEHPAVLVIGAGDSGAGLGVLRSAEQINIVQSDVVIRPNVSVILDSHDIPFEDDTFDAVVAQAVLEHVLDPHRCVHEIWRVLKADGLVYIETPFMQQVHGGRYDFTRYTFLGHRRLLRRFSQVDSGIVAGPGAALAWAWEYFLMSFCRTRRSRLMARSFGRATSFYLKYFDHFLSERPGAYDAASAFGFLGKKAPIGAELTDTALLDSYRGLIR